MTNPKLGIVTALAVFAHEIPQEVGDLAILLHGGYSRARAMALNLLSSLTSVAGRRRRVVRAAARHWNCCRTHWRSPPRASSTSRSPT